MRQPTALGVWTHTNAMWLERLVKFPWGVESHGGQWRLSRNLQGEEFTRQRMGAVHQGTEKAMDKGRGGKGPNLGGVGECLMWSEQGCRGVLGAGVEQGVWRESPWRGGGKGTPWLDCESWMVGTGEP